MLERGELQLKFEDGQLALTYFDHSLPINPRQAPRVYRTGLTKLTQDLGASDPHLLEFLSITTALQKMPAHTESSPDRTDERYQKSIG